MARPFLKWAGGKAKLVPAIVAAAPHCIETYIEPFLGGGAVFFALHEAGLARRSLLADSNAELIETYRALQADPECLIAALELPAAAYLAAGAEGRADIYYAIRAAVPGTPAARAARTIFLNKTCFNGLYRVNRDGHFNVPHGDYARPAILDREALREASAALQGATLLSEDFQDVCARAKPGDFVYLDPPYHPLSKTANFTTYTSGAFGVAEQRRLRDVFAGLTDRGIAAVLSNSDHPFIRELYAGPRFRLQTVSMSRAINSVGSRRSPISELLISNSI